MTATAWVGLLSGGPDSPDGALVARVLAGDRDAFDSLLSLHRRAVWGLAYRMTGRRADADDLCQEIFLRAYHALARFDRSLAFAPWLRKLACRHVLNHLRARRRSGTDVTFPEDDDTGALSATSPDPEQALLARARDERLRRALVLLPERQRLAVTLRYVEDLTSAEVADALGVSVNTVKTWLFRGRERLRQELGDAL